MANDAKTPNDELDDMAFAIYREQAARTPLRAIGEQDAIAAYRKADAFLSVRKRMRAGELKAKEPTGPQLADCCCPNQPRTYPLNLVAKTFTDRKSGAQTPGDLGKVNRIREWLDKNPTPETNPEELRDRLNHEFPDLNWDVPTINVARAVFPAYAVK